MQCPRCQQANPPQAKFCPECATPLRLPPDSDGDALNVAQRLAEAVRREQEAREQQGATSAILRVISNSPNDAQPAFDAIVASAVRLCDARFGLLYRWDGENLFGVASHGATPAMEEIFRRGARPAPSLLRSHGPWRPLHILDIRESEPYRSGWAVWREAIDAETVRTILVVPLVKSDRYLGCIMIYRREIRAFTERQIELLTTFADQAVIAVENVRLFKELEARNHDLTRALARETATSEILRVISSSPTDVQPVFDAIVRSAVTLCGAILGAIYRRDGGLVRLVGLDPRYPYAEEVRASYPAPVTSPLMSCRAIHDNAIVQLPDTETPGALPPEGLRLARLSGFRSVAAVPMRREGEPIGAILVGRPAVGAFPDQQIGLLQAFADQAVIAVENVRLFNELQDKNTALTKAHAQVTQALEQQTATSEILRVISSSPTDVQPVFTALATSAARLCEAHDATIFRIDGEVLRLVAHEGPIAPDTVLPLTEGTLGGRVMRLGRAIHVADMQSETYEYPMSSAVARNRGFRTILSVPLLHGAQAIGIIAIRRVEVRPFTDRQVQLVKTFADQAVIAIENVRLFKELEARNAELTESLSQQTATSEILSVIARSPTDVQPVFDTVVGSAARLCHANDVAIYRREGDRLRFVAHQGSIPPPGRVGEFVRSLERGSVTGRSVLEARLHHVADVQTEADQFPAASDLAQRLGFRTLLSVPLIREGTAIGTIMVRRTEARLFTERQVALLQTFADQAVIAIENVRLFSELQEKNQALTAAHAQVTDALDQQTATSEILRVISRSPTDLQPVFDVIAESAARLCDGIFGAVYRLDGHTVRIVAHHNISSEGWTAYQALYPRALNRQTNSGRAMLEGRVAITEDVAADVERSAATREAARSMGLRSAVTVPLVSGGRTIGALTVGRDKPGAFTTKQVALLQTFADQAVIAIENVRLFNETTEALERQTATGEVLRIISSSPSDAKPVFEAMVRSARRLCDATYSAVYQLEGDVVHLVAHNHHKPEAVDEIGRAWPLPLSSASSIVVWAIREQTTIHTADVQAHLDSLDPATLARARALDLRSMLVIPMVRDGKPIGAIRVSRTEPSLFSDKQVALLQTFANQAVIAIENVRLFKELEGANRELSAASQHKSEFLANMSHELRTPLNAIIGFSEVLTDRMFGQLNEKQEEYLKDINASGGHLLSLINDILDLSKIEAGRMELELTDFDLPMALDNALMLVRERAQRRGLTLHRRLDSGVGQLRGDERKIRQVVLNLLSNAIKFTPEGGRIEVGAMPKDGFVEVSVSDTGIGIAPEDQEKVFEEFRQVGSAAKKIEGTGLGLTLCRKFVELHGGKIWVESQVGMGSTFTFTIPVRYRE